MEMRKSQGCETRESKASKPVIIQHSRTEQQMVVSLTDYQLQAHSRFRNWRLSERNNSFRPPTTISEFLYAESAALQDALR